jgi:hypothetical protein
VKIALVVLLLASGGVALVQSPAAPDQQGAAVPYPDGYRLWTHVKSTAVGPAHPRFAAVGGFQHLYANAVAMEGYPTRAFRNGSVIVFEWLEMRDTNGTFVEGPRRQVDVMVKDARRYGATGGWGFQRFVKDSRTDLAASPTPQECFACHLKLGKADLVLSSYRP